MTAYLAKLACDEDHEGYPAKGIALRMFRTYWDEDSRLDFPVLANALLDDSCEGKQYLSEETKAELRELAKQAPSPEDKAQQATSTP